MQVRFGEFLLDADRRELTRAGEPCHLSTKAFMLLEFLVENAPNAVTKEDLYHRLWGDAFVEQVNLPNLVSIVRAALGDSPRAPRFIKTIHRYGYVFGGEVLREDIRAGARASPHVFSLFWRHQELPLREGANVIGRGDESDVTIDSASVSRRHAVITISGRSAFIEDLRSKNGTFVGGNRISATAALGDGDELRVGQVSLTLRSTSRTSTTVSHIV